MNKQKQHHSQKDTSSTEKSTEDTHNPQQGAQQEQASHLETSAGNSTSTNDQVLRLQAEFANYKRRALEDLERSKRDGKATVLRAFIDLFDNFELALKHYNKENADEFHKGMEMLFAKLISTAEECGLARIHTDNSFNPVEHEALLTETSDKEEGTILEELQSGYKLDETVLRTAKVKVSKK